MVWPVCLLHILVRWKKVCRARNGSTHRKPEGSGTGDAEEELKEINEPAREVLEWGIQGNPR